MKKLVCILLCSILLLSVPFKGYASSAVFFGMSEEYVLAFLASLLGVQAVNNIDTSEELKAYNDTLYNRLLDTLAGEQNAINIAYWISQAAIGNIDTSSVIWQKFYEIALDNYVVASTDSVDVSSNTSLGTDSFTVYYFDYYIADFGLYLSTGEALVYRIKEGSGLTVVGASTSPNDYFTSYNTNYYFTNTYTYDGKTVYYRSMGGIVPPNNGRLNYPVRPDIGNNMGKYSWEMVYGDYSIPSENISSYSDSFDAVLSSSEKSDLIDGTSVLQLYNPAVAQNGLQIVPDPEDPNDIKIPAMLTADWYNFLKQFGSGAQQFVEAYNALNGAEGVSTGAINGLYNKLGIASAVNSASAAAQGTLTLTDNNVFPQMTTVADAVTGVIPGALTPVAPDSGITNDSDQGLYKLPDLRDFFPFCIPFDFIDLLSCFVAEPETPEFVIALSDGSHLADHEISLESFDNIASIVRTLELALFILGLMLITRNLIRG